MLLKIIFFNKAMRPANNLENLSLGLLKMLVRTTAIDLSSSNTTVHVY